MNEAQSSRLDQLIDSDFWGVVHITLPDRVLYSRTGGLADRAHSIPNTLDTQFAIASGAKGFTALAVMSLVAEGALALDTKIQSLLGEANNLVDPATTVRHLLAHTSGMGDYLDESAISNIEDYVLEIPVHRLARPADFLPMLLGRPVKFPPGTSFSYCNSGYVLLALAIEAVTKRSYYDVIEERVFAPAEMQETAFLRLDELPGRAALGYLPQ
ncbi:MAG TPA: serine hydrolase domain-containing protein, partial [Candidatus Eisenbacteria bacterium]|nr:serine hydrolase domain-containing protein [Candidatus Eisenbacteria bacterium]